jgi:hypothetical protein
MLDDGSAARDRIRDLRQESESLLAQQLELEKELIGKQTEIQMLDKAIVAKSRSLEVKEPDVSNARSFRRRASKVQTGSGLSRSVPRTADWRASRRRSPGARARIGGPVCASAGESLRR